MKYLILFFNLLFTISVSFGQDLIFDFAVSFKENLTDTNPMNELRSTSDEDGNLYTAALYNGTIDMDPGASEVFFTSTLNNDDIFIQKLSPTGDFLWGMSLGAINADYFGDIKVDNSGNIIVTGSFSASQGTHDILGGPEVYQVTLKGSTDAFVAKISPNGELLWVKTFGSSDSEESREIAITTDNHIIVAGYYKSTMDVDPGPNVSELTGIGTMLKTFIVELDSNGEFVKKASITSTQGTHVTGLTISNEGYLTIGGGFAGVLDADPGTNVVSVQGSNIRDIMLIQLDTDFNYRWHYHFTGSAYENITAIKKDANDNIYAVGDYNGTAYFQPGVPTSSPAQNTVFLIKVDENGQLSDYKLFSGTNIEHTYTLALDDQQAVYLSIRFIETLDVDPGIGIVNVTTQNSTIAENCLIKLNNNLELVWYHHFDGTGEFYNIEMYQNEGLLLSGSIVDSLVIDPLGEFTLYNTNGGGFLAKLYEHECANMTLITQEVNSVKCDSLGSILLNTLNGISPIIYQWEHLDNPSDSSITIDSAGTYSVVVTDYLGCQRAVTYIVPGPVSQYGFDQNANLIGGSFRSGFPTSILIDAFNDGCMPVSGSLTLTLDPLLSVDSFSIAPILFDNNQLVWNLSSTTIDSVHFTPKIYITVSANAQIGDSICFGLSISPSQNDIDTTNNNKSYCFPVINGYDPNDIRINPVKNCDVNYLLLDEVHTYTIRFQNTGNAEAVNIIVIDTLSSQLDITTFRVLGKSYEKMYVSLEGNNILKFHMDSIMLLDSATNEALSQGYIIYEIYPLTSVAENTIINNKAEIYFDFNPAVITNTVSTLLVSEMNCDLSLDSIESIEKDLHIYPNPVNNELTIKISPAYIGMSYNIVDQYGKVIITETFTSIENTINLSLLSTGLYLMNVQENNMHAKIFKY